MWRQISLLPTRAFGAAKRHLVPANGRSASRAAKHQHSGHDGFGRHVAENRLLMQPIKPLRTLQGRKISFYLRDWIEYYVRASRSLQRQEERR